jgi:hypothetical protein
MAGFSLVELMLSLSLGFALSGVMLQGLMAEGQNGARLSRLLRERASQRRTLELVKQDLAQATAVSATPELELHACPLSGRSAVLHLSTAAGAITYSVGAAPSAIWRGRVLMRCGPAYSLEGRLAAGGAAQNRVVIDALALDPSRWSGCSELMAAAAANGGVLDLGGSSQLGFSACLEPSSGVVALRLVQDISAPPGRPPQRLISQGLAGG